MASGARAAQAVAAPPPHRLPAVAAAPPRLPRRSPAWLRPRRHAPVSGYGAGRRRHGGAHAGRAKPRRLAELEATLAGFDGCSLKATAKNLCFYRGAAKARLMLIGEAPGRDEDLEGKPFVGRAGQLLDKMLAAIGLTEQDVHITNIVYWRPPGNRTPTPAGGAGLPAVPRAPGGAGGARVVVLLGGAAAKHMLDVAEGIMRVRGKLRDVEIGARKVRAIATLHPAYLLRTPAAKRLAWRDLLAIKAALWRLRPAVQCLPRCPNISSGSAVNAAPDDANAAVSHCSKLKRKLYHLLKARAISVAYDRR